MHSVVTRAAPRFLTFTRLLGQDEPAARFLGDRLGLVFTPPYTIIGIFGEGMTLRGGFLFNGRTAANIDVTFYGPGCLTRRVMEAAAVYVFRDQRCERATARCRRSNVTMRRQMGRAGWTEEGVQRRYWGPTKYDDAVLYGLLASDLPRYLRQGGL